MEVEFSKLNILLSGEWSGEGFAKFPTIQSTYYTEHWVFEPEPEKDVIHYDQKTHYKNNSETNGKTVFWDTGFLLLKEDKILWVSAQWGGRVETYELTAVINQQFTFESTLINNDLKTIRSQRILKPDVETLEYELNMSTRQATDFQNHLTARLKKIR